MHPIEHLRHVARVWGTPSAEVAQDAADGLAAMAGDPAALVVACRRLVARNPAAAPVWWLCAQVLAAGEPRAAARQAQQRLADDATVRQLTGALPEGASVVILGDPELVRPALVRRGDLRIAAVDVDGRALALVDDLVELDVDVEEVPESGLGHAVRDADLVLLVAEAAGPEEILAPATSLAAAAVASVVGVATWVVVAEGRLLPGELYDALIKAVAAGPALDDLDRVPRSLATVVVGPDGADDPANLGRWPTCPVAAELLGARP